MILGRRYTFQSLSFLLKMGTASPPRSTIVRTKEIIYQFPLLPERALLQNLSQAKMAPSEEAVTLGHESC